jgi:HAMP domain-containing protein
VPRPRGTGLPLRLVLTVPFVVQLLGIVGVVGYLSYRSGKNAVHELAYQLMVESSDRITSDLNGYLQSAHQINRANIAALESGVVSLQDLDQLHRYMILQHLQLPAVTGLMLGTPEGEFRVIHWISPPAAAAGLSDVKPTELPYEAGRSDAAEPSRLNLYTINEAGQLERYAGTVENLDVRDRPWYWQAAETGQPGWSEPFQIGASNELTINGYTPFYDASQRFAGVFSVNLALDRLNDFLAEHSVSPSGQVFIMERNGLLIANSTGELPFTSSHTAPRVATETPPIFIPGEIAFHRLSMATSANPVIRATSEAITTQVGDLDTLRSAQNLEMVIRDETQAESLGCRPTACPPYFLRITPYQDDYGLDWLIVTVVPQSDFMGAINANVRRTFMLCGVALVGVIGLGIWTARRIARSLSRLTQATQSVAAGDLDTTLPHTRIAEVEVLTTAFGQMALELRQAAQLQQHYAQNLEQQVAEKTAALTEAQRIARVGSWEVDVATGASYLVSRTISDSRDGTNRRVAPLSRYFGAHLPRRSAHDPGGGGNGDRPGHALHHRTWHYPS